IYDMFVIAVIGCKGRSQCMINCGFSPLQDYVWPEMSFDACLFHSIELLQIYRLNKDDCRQCQSLLRNAAGLFGPALFPMIRLYRWRLLFFHLKFDRDALDAARFVND